MSAISVEPSLYKLGGSLPGPLTTVCSNMHSKLSLLCLGVVFLVAISEARPAGDSNGGSGDHHHHHHHTHHTHHTHHSSVGGGSGGNGGSGGGNGGGGDGGDGDGGHVHTHHHKGSPHVHHFHTDGSTHHHRTGGDGGDSTSSSSDGNQGGGSPSLHGDLNLPDINLSGSLGGKGGKGPSGSLNLGGLTGDLDGNLGGLTGDLDGNLSGLTGDLDGNLNLGGGGGGDGGIDDENSAVERGDGGLARDGSGGLRVPPFLDYRGENVSLDGGTPPEDLVKRFKKRLAQLGINPNGISDDVYLKLANHQFGHLGVDSTQPRDCLDEYYFNDGVLKHFVRGTRDAGDALLSGLHALIGDVVGTVPALQNLDDGLLRGLQQLVCGAENAFSDFADDFDSATHIAKHGLIDIFKLEGDGLAAFPEGILGIGEEALQAIGSAAYDAVGAIGRGFDTLEQHAEGP